MSRYSDFVIRQIQENSGSIGQVPFVFYQISGASIKNKIPYELSIGKEEEEK